MPKELYEASSIDGASFFRTYRSVFVPLSLPALATVSILMGVDTWNQYLWPILVSQTDYSRPISVAIASFFGQDEIYWDHAMAGSILMMLPILLFYMTFQRWFVTAFIGTAVKG
jgi:multiple sugar transport system permease protein